MTSRLPQIPAVTLWRPWTTAILRGKSVENRGWATTYRGPVYLHAGRHFDADALAFAGDLGIDLSANTADHPTGIVGLADLFGVCRPWDDCECGPWAALGQHHWQLCGVVALSRPVDCRGYQGLWWPHRVLDAAGLTRLHLATLAVWPYRTETQ